MIATLSLLLGLAFASQETSWDPEWFPLAEGNLWVYRQTTVQDGKETSQVRLKTARRHANGVFRLDDPDGDDYLFSSDGRGLLLHGEVKPDGAAVAFEPPLGYVTPELLRRGEAVSAHKADDRTIHASAQLLGPRIVDAEAVGQGRPSLATRFEYKTGSRTFAIENDFVRGVGAVRRRFRLTREDGGVVFESRHELLAARVGGVVHGGEDRLATLAFEHASAHREVFGPTFPGFVRRVRVTEGKDVVADVRLEVGCDGRILALTPLGNEGRIPRWAEHEIRSIVGHRRGHSSSGREERPTLKYAAAEGPRVGVLVEGDAMGSKYEVGEGVLWMVSRLEGDRQRFRIDVHEVQWTPRGRYLPKRYEVSYQDKDGSPREKREVWDLYVPLGEDWIPERRTVKTGDRVRTFEFLEWSKE
jgi:hypothetical protein